MEDPRPEVPADAAERPAPVTPGAPQTAAAPDVAEPPSPPPEPGIGFLPAPRLDVPMAVVLGLVFLGALTPFLGVWEPWEAQQAAFAASLREAGAWLVAELPKGDAKTAIQRFELPYGWWPVRISLKVFGETELGLRLPGLLGSLAVLAVLMATVRALWGRLAGWFSVLALLSMPLFAFHGRQNFGLGLASAALAIGALSLLRRAADPVAPASVAWLGWLATAVSALTGALAGLVIPLAAALGAALLAPTTAEARRAALRRVFSPGPAAVGALLVLGG
jgi:4-amino-4-deoxy-L-arabinose transferase-like glycosyltransferase